MADPDILHELRLLADLSENLHRLLELDDGLRHSLAENVQNCEPAESAILQAALHVDCTNAVLRNELAQECEQKRYHLIRSCKFKNDLSFVVQLENAFLIDWYACSDQNVRNSEFEKLDRFGICSESDIRNWGFDDGLQDQIIEALQPGPDLPEPEERQEEADCIILDRNRSLSVAASSEPSNIQPYDYGFPVQDCPYRFDAQPESSITMQVLSPGSGSESIKAGSLTKLVERLTDDKTHDLNLRFVFLLTYHSFTSAREFLDLLVERYLIPAPPNATPKEVVYFRNNKQKGIRLKVFSVIKNWVEDHYTDFDQDDDLKHYLKDLLKTCFADESWSSKLSSTILNVIQKQESGTSRTMPLDLIHRSPSPEFRCLFSLAEIESKLTEISPLEIARQLSVSDFEIFRRIEARECLNQAWSKANRNTEAPNIMRMIHRFNNVSQWCQWVILNAPTRSLRQLFLRQMIRIGERCLSLNNFTSACAIYAGLESNSVYRLRDLWETLPAKVTKLYEILQGTFKSDSKTKQHFRTLLQEAIPPCVPHLGLFLSDLTFIEDGNPDKIGGLINVSKRRKLSERIMWIKQYQQVSYQLVKVPLLQEYFHRALVPRGDEELYNLSKKIKP